MGERVCAYVRVSTEDQADKHGLDAQRTRVRGYCAARGWPEPAHWYEDHRSGKLMARVELQRLLADVRERKWDVVVAPALDRVSRNLHGLLGIVSEVFDPARCTLVCVDQGFDASTAAGRLVMSVLGAVSEYEGSKIVERVKAGKAAAREKGCWPGGHPPFGFRAVPQVVDVDRKLPMVLEPDGYQMDVVRQVFALDEAGITIQSVVDLLMEKGIRREPGGAPLTYKTVRTVIDRGRAFYGLDGGGDG